MGPRFYPDPTYIYIYIYFFFRIHTSLSLSLSLFFLHTIYKWRCLNIREPRASPTDCHYHFGFGLAPQNFETQRHANFECSHVLQKIISHMRSGTKSPCLNPPTLKRIRSIIIIPMNSKFLTRVYYVWFFFQIQNIGWFRSNVWGILFQEFQHSLISNCPQKSTFFFCWNTIDITSCLPPKRYQGIFQYIYRKHLPTNLRISQQKKNASQNLLTWIFFFEKKKRPWSSFKRPRVWGLGGLKVYYVKHFLFGMILFGEWKVGCPSLTPFFGWELRYVLSSVIFLGNL